MKVPALFCALLALSPAAGAAAQPAGAAGSRADFVLPGEAEPLPAPLRAALDGMRTEAFAAHVGFLASPALEGRGLGRRGVDAAAEYVAARLAASGVPPLAAGEPAKGAAPSYFHPVPMREIRNPGGAVEVERTGGGTAQRRVFLSGVDAVLPAISTRSLTLPVVDAGYGVQESAPARDDWRGLDVKGKVVVVREGVPPGEEWRTKALLGRWAEGGAEGRWERKLAIARRLGAVALVGVEGEAWTSRVLGKEKPWAFAFRSLSDNEPSDPLLVRVSPAAGDFLLPPDDAPRSLPGVTLTIRTTGEERLGASRNVVAVLAGSDPALRSEAVVLGAHYDHLGVVDGAVHPGADDNASGVAALLEIARALAGSPVRPKRTLVFAFWTGEEEDKIGSTYWVRHPLWPIGKTAAYLNFDMVGHPWTRAEVEELVSGAPFPGSADFLVRLKPEAFAEPGVASYAPWLDGIVSSAGRGTGLALHVDRTEGVDGGSDYRAFARARVPFVRFFGSFFPAYHEPGDTAAALDPAQVARIARLGLATAWLAADR